MDVDALIHKIERSQATGYMGVAFATIVYYDYILTFRHEGERSVSFIYYYPYSYMLMSGTLK
jgi:hypothetical protein